jgi:hypothetical protein
MIPLLTYRFNLMATRLWKLKLNCKKLLLLRLSKRDFIESKKKEIVAFHLNNNPFINSWLVQNRLTIGTICQF